MRPRALLGVILAAVLAVAGLSAAVVIADSRADAARESQRMALDRMEQAIREEVAATMATTGAARAVFEEADTEDPADFSSLASGAVPRPSVAWVAWAPDVHQADRGRFERQLGRPLRGFRATSAPSGSPARDSYLPVTLVEPRDGAAALEGRDMLSSPALRTIVDQAVVSGQTLISEPLRSPSGERIVAVVDPVYARDAARDTAAQRRAALVGVVVAGVRPASMGSVAGGSGGLLLSDGPVVLAGSGAGDHAMSTLVDVGGQVWRLEVAGHSPSLGLPILIGTLGVVLALAMLALTFLDVHRERYARRKVDEALESQRVVEENLRDERNRAESLRALAEGMVEDTAHDETLLLQGASRRVAAAFMAAGAGVVTLDATGSPAVVGAVGTRPEAGARAWARVVAAPGAVREEGSDSLSVIACPVFVDGRTWGAVWVAAPPARLEDDAAESLRAFADLIGLGIADAEARRRLELQATTDEQTGLANYRTFREHLNQQLALARRHGRDLALAVLDVDHFKKVNDTHGHLVGDAVLAEVARRLQRAARRSDVVARVGGEEFAWLMPEVGRLEAWSAVDRARAAVAAEPFPGAGRVTISAGVADLALAASEDELYRNADQALYLAKRYGRDIVFLHQSNDLTQAAVEDPGEVEHRRAELAHLTVLAHKVAERGHMGRDHPGRVAATATALARELGWDPRATEVLERAAILHDVGMAAVPATVELETAGPLGDAAKDLVAAHPREGAQMVRDLLSGDAAAWIRGHHERWDGSGYPDGLAGEEIPEGARILALAEAWDALITDRPYRPALTEGQAIAEIRAGAGTQFWPAGVDALAKLVERQSVVVTRIS